MLPSLFCFAVLLCAFAHGARLPDGEGFLKAAPKPSSISYTPEAEADRITFLPGWGELETFNMFSGCVEGRGAT